MCKGFHFVLAMVLAAPVAMMAQGSIAPPASIYSLGGSTLGPPPASIYSAPARSSAGFAGVQVRGGQFPRQRHAPNSGRRHAGRDRNAAPIYVPYAVYPYSFDDETDYTGEAIRGGTFDRRYDQQTPLSEAPTIFENRPGYRAPEIDAERDVSRYGTHRREEEEAPVAQQKPVAPAEVVDAPATVLIFRDGHRREITNYAIMGQTLFVFTGVRDRIPIGDLNLEATMAENDTRGIDFRVPKNQ
jgi:hypothetical protein